MTKLWLNQSNKARKLDYIQAKNRITNGVAEYDNIIGEPYHPMLSIDGFFLSKQHRWFYNFDAECVSSIILRAALTHAITKAGDEFPLPSPAELYYPVDPHSFFTTYKIKPEYEGIVTQHQQAVNKHKLDYIKANEFDSINSIQLDFNYVYGIGLHMILPFDHIISEDLMNECIQDFLLTEQNRSVVLGQYNKDWLVNYVEQQNLSRF